MTRYRYAITFEFDEAAPETVRGEVVATEASGAARRAVVAAQQAKPHRHFRSLVVLLERDRDADAAERVVDMSLTADAVEDAPNGGRE